MLHHYLQKGIKLEYLLNLSTTEKAFYKASRELDFEEEKAKLEAIILSLRGR